MPLLGPPNVSAHGARGMGFTVDIDPSPILVVAQFDKLGQDIRSFRVPLERSVREVVAPSLVKNFYVQGRPDRWPELATQTVQQKHALGFSSAASFPLVRTGRLRRVAGQLNLWHINGPEGTAELRLPEDAWYGKVHQEGSNEDTFARYTTRSRTTGRTTTTDRGAPGRVPQRIWAIIQDEDIPKVERVFERWIQERVQMAGFR